MTITAEPSPRLLSSGHDRREVLLRVTAGTLHIGRSFQEAAARDGVSVTAADGLQSFPWYGDLWIIGAPATTTTLEVLLP